jgi:predicted metalloprotease with PDZ domain
VDYYPEGELIWLDVDTIIRTQSHRKKTLNDFCAQFYGMGGNTGPKVVPYTLDQLVASLNEILPYDWASYFHTKVYTVQPQAPLEGVARGGYRIDYTDSENEFIRAGLRKGGSDAWYGAGLYVGQDGTVGDVRVASPAYSAGLGPGMKIIAVNGRKMSDEVFHTALKDAKKNSQAIELIVENDNSYRVLRLDYHGGEKYPQLVRDNAHPDLLDEILKPLVPARLQ